MAPRRKAAAPPDAAELARIVQQETHEEEYNELLALIDRRPEIISNILRCEKRGLFDHKEPHKHNTILIYLSMSIRAVDIII